MTKLRKKFASSLAAPMLALITVVPADAATIIQDFAGTSFTLAQFDASLGTLQSVSILFSPFATRVVTNPNPMAGVANFTLRGYLDFTSADAGAPVLPSWEATVADAQDRFNAEYELLVGDANQLTTFTSGLSAYIGGSSFTYTINGGVDILSASVPLGATTVNNARAAGRITYTYEAAGAVPEPATWAMMIVGFGTIGGAMRARRFKRARGLKLA